MYTLANSSDRTIKETDATAAYTKGKKNVAKALVEKALFLVTQINEH